MNSSSLSRTGALLVLLGVFSSAFASQPIRINYQSRVQTGGAAATGTHMFSFSIWRGGSKDAGNSGANLWSETVALTVTDSVVSHTLGTGGGGVLEDTIFSTDLDLFLQVSMDGNLLLPRTRLETVPFAARARVADSASTSTNGLPSGFLALSTTSSTQEGFTYTGKILPMNWQSRATIPSGREGAVGASSGNKIFVISGTNGGLSTVNQQYDTLTDVWSAKAPILTARSFATATELDGSIYVIGGNLPGNPSNITEAYNVAGDSWSTRAPMDVGRYGHCAAVVNGLVYVFGGETAGGTTASAEMYNPGTNTWTPRAALPAPRLYAGAAAVNGKIYIIGDDNDNTMYDPVANTYTAKAPMPVSSGNTVVTASNGRIFVCGNYYTVYGGQTWIYDPPSDSWTLGPQLSIGHYYAAGALVDDKIYVISGHTSGVGINFTNEMLDTSMYFVHSKN